LPGPENLAALGRIALSSTALETITESLILTLLGVEEAAGRALTEGSRPRWLVERLDRLAKRAPLDPAIVFRISDFTKGAALIFETRNANLHAFWAAIEEGGSVRLKSIVVDRSGSSAARGHPRPQHRVGPGHLAPTRGLASIRTRAAQCVGPGPLHRPRTTPSA
jgi:hypothetical protein